MAIGFKGNGLSKKGVAILSALMLVVIGAAAVQAASPFTERSSLSSAGAQGNGASFNGAVSANGRWVAFASGATNLVTNDTNGFVDVFVHDRATGQTSRVSVASNGTEANNFSDTPSISGDGRYVAFMSAATNLVPNDTNGFWDIFVHDRQTGQTTRVSLSTGGAQADSHSLFPAISGDGRYVAFESIATNLVANDTNGVVDVFVHDRNGGQTTRASVSGGGAQANGGSDKPDISYYGQYVTFQSDATNLVTGDTNAARDVFVHNRINGDTTRASVSTGGVQGDNASHLPKITGNGAAVAFSSTATNLVAGDTNAVDDIFVRYLWTNQTIRVSLDSAGNQSNGGSHTPDIAGNGDWVVFASSANNLVAGDTNAVDDIFAHAPSTGVTIRSSVSTAGTQANALSSLPSTSYDGRFTAFTSSATNLVANDTNGFNDVFVRYNGEEGGFFPGDGDDDDSGCFLQTLR